jgi:hypothetical protein
VGAFGVCARWCCFGVWDRRYRRVALVIVYLGSVLCGLFGPFWEVVVCVFCVLLLCVMCLCCLYVVFVLFVVVLCVCVFLFVCFGLIFAWFFCFWFLFVFGVAFFLLMVWDCFCWAFGYRLWGLFIVRNHVSHGGCRGCSVMSAGAGKVLTLFFGGEFVFSVVLRLWLLLRRVLSGGLGCCGCCFLLFVYCLLVYCYTKY